RLPFLASRWWLPACAPLLVANSWRSPASSLESTPSWHVSSSLPWTSLSGSCEASAVFNVSAFRGKIFSQLQINHGGGGAKRYRDYFAAATEQWEGNLEGGDDMKKTILSVGLALAVLASQHWAPNKR